MATPTNTANLTHVTAGTGDQTINAGFTFTAGRDAVVLASQYSDGHSLVGVTIGGTAATRLHLQASGLGDYLEIWYATNITGGTANVVFDVDAAAAAGSVYIESGVDEWASGAFTGEDAGTANGATGTSAAPAVSTAAATSQAATIVYAITAYYNTGTATTITGPTGWTIVCAENDVLIQDGRGAWHEESSTGTKTATFALGASHDWAASIAVLKLAGGGGGSVNSGRQSLLGVGR